MGDPREKTFRFTCPECFVSLKARTGQAGARLMCPSCSATIIVPQPPQPKSAAGKTDRTLDASAAEATGEYQLWTASPVTAASPDLITVACHVCATRVDTERKNVGSKITCPECGAVLSVVEAPKTQAQMHKPQRIDEAALGQYGVSAPERPSAGGGEVSIPFHCRLCETLLRGSANDVGKEMTCPDCGTKTVVPPPKKVDPKAFLGAAVDADLTEYELSAPQLSAGEEMPVVCSLCHSRLMARADQVGRKIQCPDCGRETLVKALVKPQTGAVIGVMAGVAGSGGGEYAAAPQDPAPPPVLADVLAECSVCGRRVKVPPERAGKEVACPDCDTLVPIPQPDASSPAGTGASRESQVEKVVYIGVDCPRCGTRLHATDREVGQKVRCPDCDCAVAVPPPKAEAPAEERNIGDNEDYAVSAPAEVLQRTPISGRALPKEPENDPDFDFLDEVDDPELRWQLSDRSNELGFLGHPGASTRWFGFSIGGVAVFAVPAISIMLFGLPTAGEMTAAHWFGAAVSLAVSLLICLAWAAMFSVSLVAIIQDTAAGNLVIRNWPEGGWDENIGECFYVFNSCMVSFIPVSILLQAYPPARSGAEYYYMLGFWLTFPPALFSMLETGSALTPVSGKIASSIFRAAGAWAWFYLRSFGLLALGLAMYIAFWRHICGPIALPLLAPMATALAMVYARWLGILGESVQETFEPSDQGDPKS